MGSEEIPSPPGWPYFGNTLEIDGAAPLKTWLKYADQYGDIFRVKFIDRDVVIVGSQALVHELCDERRFQKNINPALTEVRNGVHDGLFTARSGEEPNWGIAHRVLTPAFGPMPINAMFDEMRDVATQLAMKWARQGDKPIMVTDDFTRLTLDMLALCSMNYRFNSFYHDDMHPFIAAMGDFLTLSGVRAKQPRLVTLLSRSANRRFWDDIQVLRQTAEAVLKERKEHPDPNRHDLLSAMLDGVDPKTGCKMTDESIIDNLITFLIAGHETTSGLLSFSFHNLITHPDVFQRARQEVDLVIGTGPVRLEHLNKLPYIAAILRETLRLSPTISGIGIESKEDTLIGGGKYFVPKGQSFILLMARSHRDPRVYGETAGDFLPERMLDDNFERLTKEFPDCWKPFGNGARACIGRPFAWQEAVLVLAMLVQNFTFELADPDYKIDIKQTLTVKPKEFYMKARIREGLSALDVAQRVGAGGVSRATTVRAPAGTSVKTTRGKPLAVYYGSNTGTCEALAQRLAADAPAHGYDATIVAPLDEATGKIPKDQPVVVITASYEGQPPDNGAKFVEWIDDNGSKEKAKGTEYAVFGCGHHDWAQTFHRVPLLADAALEAQGGSRLCAPGLADAAKGEMFTVFEQWEDEVFWPAVEEKHGAPSAEDGDAPGKSTSSIAVTFSTPRTTALHQDVQQAVVVSTRVLAAASDNLAEEKRHMEIELPADSKAKFTPGDYVTVLPVNPPEVVDRVMKRFHLPRDAHITIWSDAGAGRTSLPTGISVSVVEILANYVELSQPATKRAILTLSSFASPQDRSALLSLTSSPTTFTSEISRKRTSILSLVERFPTIPLPFSVFLSLLSHLRPRTYSISSSPVINSNRLTLTYSVLNAPSLADPNVQHIGVASSYLASLSVGDSLSVALRRSPEAFHLPSDPESTPIIMIAAGTGIAPFRGFIQERAATIATGRNLAPAVLFFGCRSAGADDLFADELRRWEAMGAVSLVTCYSRPTDKGKKSEHVQDAIWRERSRIVEMWNRGAKIFVCGSRGVGESVKGVVVRIMMEDSTRRRKEDGRGETTEQEGLMWFEGIRNTRYAVDVFD